MGDTEAAAAVYFHFALCVNGGEEGAEPAGVELAGPRSAGRLAMLQRQFKYFSSGAPAAARRAEPDGGAAARKHIMKICWYEYLSHRVESLLLLLLHCR